MKIHQNILETIGNTPLIRLNNLSRGLKASIYVKCEFFNPGGSIKDRIGLNMIIDAEKKGILKPEGIIVEPTSGNTGMGLAQAAVVKGYKIIFTIPDKMSQEKIDLLKSYGAKVIITPTAVSPDHPANYVKVAERIAKTTPNAVMLNQFMNPANPEIHFNTTGPEIWEQMDGKIDYFVATMGTGGTISGVGRYLKLKHPQIQVIGVDPEGSLYHHKFYNTPGDLHTYKVEGIGEDFIPGTMDLSILNEIIIVSDKDAFLTARRLLKEEGIFVGGSAGMAVFAAIQIAKRIADFRNLVVILPDTGRNYMNKIYSDDWMIENGFLERSVKEYAVEKIIQKKIKRISKIISASPNDTLQYAIDQMQRYDVSQLPIIENGIIVGSLVDTHIMKKIATEGSSKNQKVGDVMDPPFPIVSKSQTILSPFSLLKDKNAFIVMEGKEIIDIITTTDVVNFLMMQ